MASRPKLQSSLAWANRRPGVAALCLLALLAAYLLGSRAEDTGSLQQYFLTIVLLVFAINRAVRAIRPSARKAAR